MNENITIILSGKDENRALLALVIATTSASLGKNVNIFFAFEGIEFIKKDFIEKSENQKKTTLIKRLINDCRDLNVKFLACSLSFEMFDIKKDEIIENVEIASSITLINSMDTGKTIFI